MMIAACSNGPHGRVTAGIHWLRADVGGSWLAAISPSARMEDNLPASEPPSIERVHARPEACNRRRVQAGQNNKSPIGWATCEQADYLKPACGHTHAGRQKPKA